MATRPPSWMFVTLGLQLALALAGVAAVSGIAQGMAQHPVAFAHDDVPLLFPAVAVIVLGVLAITLWRSDRRRIAITLAIMPFPVAAALMAWAWW